MSRFSFHQVVVVAMLGAALCGCSGAADKGAVAGHAAPAFSASDLDGKPVALADLRGKVVVLNEWATWCEPCRVELPLLEKLHEELAPQGLVLVGVSIDAFGTANDVRDFAKEHGLSYRIWLDPDKKFAAQFMTIGVPETFVINKDGTVRFRHIGAIRDGDTTVTAAVRAALAQS
jgi:cytochrome c-type biogenesis protein